MAESHKGRDGGTFIDRALRERVDGDISAFLAAFDAALEDDTAESRAGQYKHLTIQEACAHLHGMIEAIRGDVEPAHAS